MMHETKPQGSQQHNSGHRSLSEVESLDDKGRPEKDICHATSNANPATLPSPTISRNRDLETGQLHIGGSHECTGDVGSEAIAIPVEKRRGMLARLVILGEVMDPKDYSRGKKWFITFVVATAALAAPMASTILFPALPDISRDLHADPTVTNLSTALYMLAMSIFPIWWSSFSETYGRRNIYIISFSLFLVWNILSALSVNIAMLIVMRILGGGAAASVQAVGAGTIADIWPIRERGKAMGIFYLGPLMGPLVAPIIGGVLAESLGWRSTQWFLAVYGGIVLAFMIFALPETLPHRDVVQSAFLEQRDRCLTRTSTRQSVTRTLSATNTFIKRGLVDPLKTLLYLKHVPVSLTVYYASITFGSLYLLNISLETTFSAPPYGFSTEVLGLTYIPASVGYILASVIGGRWTDAIMAREARRRRHLSVRKSGQHDTHTTEITRVKSSESKLVYRPEDRLGENAWLAAVLYPAAMICYGWTAQVHTPWPVPLMTCFFFGFGSMLIFGATTTMLTEFMPERASAGVAVNNFVRNIFSCVGAVVAHPVISALGNGWVFTAVGTWAMLSGFVVLFVLRTFGGRWKNAMVS